MSKLKIGTRDDRRNFRPGEELAGAAGWELEKEAKVIEVRLIWFTRGKGTEDVGLMETVRFDQPQLAEARPFQFRLPAAPYSFSGKLISLLWALELVVLPSKESARFEFVLAPDGKEVLLDSAA
jgi:hypothetical protein